ncbi:MAG: 3-hydroxyacyl-ACP dehydratase FabZ [Candidatus Sumerlaeia bacterium]
MTVKVQERLALAPAVIDLTQLPIGIERIREILPHRYPFLMIDRLVEYSPDHSRLVGIKNVTGNEPYFTGHFPTISIMPGVLQIEAMAQVGAILALTTPEGVGRLCVLAGVNNARFRKPVVPGDQLRIIAQAISLKRRAGKILGRCEVDGKVTSEAEILFTVGDPTV